MPDLQTCLQFSISTKLSTNHNESFLSRFVPSHKQFWDWPLELRTRLYYYCSLKFGKKAANKCCGVIFSLVQMLFSFVLNSDSQSYITIPQHKGKQNLNHWWVEKRYLVKYLNWTVETVSSLIRLPFRHYDCGRKKYISIMYIKRRSCLLLHLLFQNVVST